MFEFLVMLVTVSVVTIFILAMTLKNKNIDIQYLLEDIEDLENKLYLLQLKFKENEEKMAKFSEKNLP